jgi:hypothetical protein
MARSTLFQDDYRPQFSGHETFPLRYGWLKKVVDSVRATESEEENKSVFISDDAIAHFGVGKNMVGSMRHWANATGVVGETSRSIKVTKLGRKLFGPKGLDPYMEHPATLWLMHWHLAGRDQKTTWFWAFNHSTALTFERDHLVKALERIAKDRNWARVSTSTIRNDVACFIRTYVSQQPQGQLGNEEALESPLTELGLIKAVGKRDGFRFVRGQKTTLGNGVFAFALLDFWSRFATGATLSFEAVAHEPGSPGRVFQLDENDVADRLAALAEVTGGVLTWSETAGLKQVVRKRELSAEDAIQFIESDYRDDLSGGAA